jgi:hypothetical protein
VGAGGQEAPKSSQEVVAQLASRLARWDDRYHHLHVSLDLLTLFVSVFHCCRGFNVLHVMRGILVIAECLGNTFLVQLTK